MTGNKGDENKKGTKVHDETFSGFHGQEQGSAAEVSGGAGVAGMVESGESYDVLPDALVTLDEIIVKIQELGKLPHAKAVDDEKNVRRMEVANEIKQALLKLPEAKYFDEKLSRAITSFGMALRASELEAVNFTAEDKEKLFAAGGLKDKNWDFKAEKEGRLAKNMPSSKDSRWVIEQAEKKEENVINIGGELKGRAALQETAKAKVVEGKLAKLGARCNEINPKDLDKRAPYSTKMKQVVTEAGSRFFGGKSDAAFKQDQETQELLKELLKVEYKVEDFENPGKTKQVKLEDLADHMFAHVTHMERNPAWETDDILKEKVPLVRAMAEKYDPWSKMAKDPRSSTAQIIDRTVSFMRYATGAGILTAAALYGEAAYAGIAGAVSGISFGGGAGGGVALSAAATTALIATGYGAAALAVIGAGIYLYYKNQETVNKWCADNIGANLPTWEGTRNTFGPMFSAAYDVVAATAGAVKDVTVKTAVGAYHLAQETILEHGGYKPGRADKFKGDDAELQAVENAVTSGIVMLRASNTHQNYGHADLLKSIEPRDKSASELVNYVAERNLNKVDNQLGTIKAGASYCYKNEDGVVMVPGKNDKQKRKALLEYLGGLNEAKANLDRLLIEKHGSMGHVTYRQIQNLREDLKIEIGHFNEAAWELGIGIAETAVKDVIMGVSKEEAEKRLPIARETLEHAKLTLSGVREVEQFNGQLRERNKELNSMVGSEEEKAAFRRDHITPLEEYIEKAKVALGSAQAKVDKAQAVVDKLERQAGIKKGPVDPDEIQMQNLGASAENYQDRAFDSSLDDFIQPNEVPKQATGPTVMEKMKVVGEVARNLMNKFKDHQKHSQEDEEKESLLPKGPGNRSDNGE